ncbi:hypothetical protein P4S68_13140 [Pseudoalteromonas sp. Hal099]
MNTAKTLVKALCNKRVSSRLKRAVIKIGGVFTGTAVRRFTSTMAAAFTSAINIKFLTILSSSPTVAHATEQLRKSYEQKHPNGKSRLL